MSENKIIVESLQKLDGDTWSRILSQTPELAEYCPWGILDMDNWFFVLATQPQFF